MSLAQQKCELQVCGIMYKVVPLFIMHSAFHSFEEPCFESYNSHFMPVKVELHDETKQL